MKTNLRILLYTTILCTPIGWAWGFWHVQSGVMSGWIFPLDAYSGIEFCGMVLEDWLFYPVTGSFFVSMILWDLLKKPLCWIFKTIRYSKKFEENLKWCLYVLLIWSIAVGVGVFGNSGTMTACYFGVPSLVLFAYIWHDYNVWHYLRTAIVVIPIEFFWDHWAVGQHQQWVYLPESGIFSHLSEFWFRDIPCEMSPYLGIMSTYFIFSVTLSIKKLKYN